MVQTPASVLPTATLDAYPVPIQRLARVGRLWGVVRYLNPRLPYADIDWDGAVLAAIPRIRAAADKGAYIDAVRDLLAVLDDPLTKVYPAPASRPVSASVPLSSRTLDGDILLVDLGTGDTRAHLLAMSALVPSIQRATSVIFDMRRVTDSGVSILSRVFASIDRYLVDREVVLPSMRGVVHSGYKPQSFNGSGGYYSAISTLSVEPVTPADAGIEAKRVVFVLGEVSALPGIAVPLRALGRAAIVSPRALDDYAFSYTRRVDLGEGFFADVRVSDGVYGGALIDMQADRIMPTSGDDDSPAIRAAVELAREAQAERTASDRGDARAPTHAEVVAAPVWRPDNRYESIDDPGLEYRILAAYRLWNVIHYFYPYLELLGDWDPVLPMAVAELDAANGSRDYVRAVAKVAALVADTHTSVRGPMVYNVFPRAIAPFVVRMVEGVAVVVALRDAEAARGIAVGDIVDTVDGRPLAQAMADLRPYVAASHEVGKRERLLRAALSREEGATIRVGVRGPDDSTRTVAVVTSMAYWQRDGIDLDEPRYRLIEPDIGYVDLRRLQIVDVDAMFEAMKHTRAIVFDMRGYPNGTAWHIAPRLIRSSRAVHGARFERPVASAIAHSRITFRQPIAPSDKWIYTGDTYMLIDERAISQAEHTGLFFEAANGTRFIGTETAGANGDVTDFFLPGGVSVLFTGHDVRHADGRQLQRIGLVPHVRVAPTIAGVRAGDDEVLARAIEYARSRMSVTHARLVQGDAIVAH